MKKVAVVLSGCGYRDGSEVIESVATLIALSELGASFFCFAPDTDFVPSRHAKQSHDSPVSSDEKRNILVESARISRGEIDDLRNLDPKDYDALVFPGGAGAAIHLSTWATDGVRAKVTSDVSRVIRGFHESAKPIGAICIAPAIVAKVLGKKGVSVTIGNDAATAAEIEKTGATHVRCTATDYVSDRDHKVLSTPAYMLDAKPHEVFMGVRKMLKELVEMA